MSKLDLSQEHLDLTVEAGDDAAPAWTWGRKAYVICFKLLVKNEFLLSSLLWGEKKYGRVFGVNCFALALSGMNYEHWDGVPRAEWQVPHYYSKTKHLEIKDWAGVLILQAGILF